ncbi:MAG: NAD-dependent succinate-semialdehyde dehydrogenase [Rikenellaceae bacterium]
MNFGFKKMYIDGVLCDSVAAKTMDVISPATGTSVAQIAVASKEDTERALEAAQKGFDYWSKLSLAERNVWIAKLRDAVIARKEELHYAVMYEMGKTWESADEDIEMICSALDYYPNEMLRYRSEILPDAEGTHSHLLVHEPRGVVVAILAWNFPILNVAYKVAPALAAGCSIIIRPSADSPISAYLFGEICAEIGFPAGVINVLTGRSSETSIPMSESVIPRVLTMIGSTATGCKLVAQSATSIKKLGLELGGNAPALIFDDCDLDKAVAVMAGLKYNNSGQVCVTPNRIFVQASIYDKFMEMFKKKVAAIKVGFGRDKGITMGPVINAKARERIMGLIEDAVAKGATLTMGGDIPAGMPEGSSYMNPTVLENVTPDMRCYSEEIFGPIAPIIKFETEEQLDPMVNLPDSGLASYLFTGSLARVNKYSRFIQSGEVQVNGVKYAINLPHGGVGNSGLGHDCSHLALEDYLHTKRISISL